MLKNFRPKLLLKKTWKEEFKDFHGVLNLNSCKYLQRWIGAEEKTCQIYLKLTRTITLPDKTNRTLKISIVYFDKFITLF